MNSSRSDSSGADPPALPTLCQEVQAPAASARSSAARGVKLRFEVVMLDYTLEAEVWDCLAALAWHAVALRHLMAQDSLIGRTIAGYTLKKDVGEGGTAQVFSADHDERGEVALKVLRSRLASDPVAVKRFLREAEFGARVVHPNVVRTFDFGEDNGVYYLALEWAGGEPLEEFITRSGPIAPPVAAISPISSSS